MKISHNVHGVDISTAIQLDYDKCIGCQMCVKTCNDSQKIGSFQLAPLKQPPYVHSITGHNEMNTETTRVKLQESNCIGCGQCVTVCTTGAIMPRNRISEINAAKQNGQVLVAVVAPATRVGVAEGMGMEIGSSCEKQLISALKQLGFDYVFDNLWGADVCTIEDAQEVLKSIKNKTGPIFTSCCPAWINLAETRYPEVLAQISTAKSPNAITCAMIKHKFAEEINKKSDEICVVGIMPCTAKKFEAVRNQLGKNGVQDCDISITSREIIQMMQEKQIQFSEEKENQLDVKFDGPFNEYSGSAYIFGKTAGVTESVVRYVYALNKQNYSLSLVNQYLLWESADQRQSLKVFAFEAQKQTFKAIISHGGQACEELMKLYNNKRLDDINVIEVMMCPSGCVNGGGQPKQAKKALIPQRSKGLDKHDKNSSFQDCESNQKMHELLNKWIKNDEEKHDLLHTHYENRKMQ